MFSNETLLSIAAKLGNMEIFRYLVKHGAPISPVGAKFSPLFAGIRQNNLEIVSTMLSLGADPNQFMLNKNNKPYYPLDVAISKGFNQAVALLITFGANTSLVNQKRIKDQNIKNMLNNMALPNITVDNKPYKEIETLKSRFDKFKKEILSFVQKIISKPGVSLETVENILNKIRKLFSDSIQFMCDLQPIANEINEMSRPLLNRQLEIYNIWSKQPPSPTSSQIYRLNDGRKIPDELESEWNQNRIKLVEQALTIHAYTHLAAKAFTQIDNLRNESIEYINDGKTCFIGKDCETETPIIVSSGSTFQKGKILECNDFVMHKTPNDPISIENELAVITTVNHPSIQTCVHHEGNEFIYAVCKEARPASYTQDGLLLLISLIHALHENGFLYLRLDIDNIFNDINNRFCVCGFDTCMKIGSDKCTSEMFDWDDKPTELTDYIVIGAYLYYLERGEKLFTGTKEENKQKFKNGIKLTRDEVYDKDRRRLIEDLLSPNPEIRKRINILGIIESIQILQKEM